MVYTSEVIQPLLHTAPGLKHLRQLLRRIVRRSGEVQKSIKHDSHEAAHGLPVKSGRGDFLGRKASIKLLRALISLPSPKQGRALS